MKNTLEKTASLFEALSLLGFKFENAWLENPFAWFCVKYGFTLSIGLETIFCDFDEETDEGNLWQLAKWIEDFMK